MFWVGLGTLRKPKTGQRASLTLGGGQHVARRVGPLDVARTLDTLPRDTRSRDGDLGHRATAATTRYLGATHHD